MKPVQIGILVLIGAMGGALIMRFSQRQAAGIVPAPIVTAPPVVAAPPVPAQPPAADQPPAVATRAPVEPARPAEPAPSLPKKVAVARVHRAKPERAAITTVAQNLPPASVPGAPDLSATEPSAPEPAQEAQTAPAEVTPAPAPLAAPERTEAPAPETVPPPAPSVTLRPGMLLPVRLGESLSSEHNQTGDTFTATLDSPLVADGFVIAERGARLEGRVVEAQKVKGQSTLALQLITLNTSDGQRVAIQTDPFRKQAATSTEQNVGIVAAAAGVGAVIGAMAGGGKGAGIGAAAGGAAGTGGVIASRAKAVALPPETKISFRLSQTITITERLNH